ncbi:MAG: hypothetical protein HQL41_17585, partial [Alphaproteobacteria bacterium]|nr:hypothetical protein [Alphaproteobacteria bacterium]
MGFCEIVPTRTTAAGECPMIGSGETFVAVLIQPSGRGYHVGLVYRHGAMSDAIAVDFIGGPPHVGVFRGDPNTYLASVIIPDPHLRAAVASTLGAFLELYRDEKDKSRDVPYSVHMSKELHFDDLLRFTGNESNGDGMTCTTFVARLLQMSAYPIVDLSTWESRPDDAAWQKNYLAKLRHHI